MDRAYPLSAFVCGVTCALFAGCSGRSTESKPPAPQSPSAAAATAAPAVPLVIANWEETERLIAAERGKVVVLDLWATW